MKVCDTLSYDKNLFETVFACSGMNVTHQNLVNVIFLHSTVVTFAYKACYHIYSLVFYKLALVLNAGISVMDVVCIAGDAPKDEVQNLEGDDN